MVHVCFNYFRKRITAITSPGFVVGHYTLLLCSSKKGLHRPKEADLCRNEDKYKPILSYACLYTEKEEEEENEEIMQGLGNFTPL